MALLIKKKNKRKNKTNKKSKKKKKGKKKKEKEKKTKNVLKNSIWRKIRSETYEFKILSKSLLLQHIEDYAF